MTPLRTETFSLNGCTASLLCGDALELLPGIRADVAVTDPPYGISHSSNHGASWQRTQIAGDSDTSVRDAALEGFENVAAFGTWKTPPIRDTKAVLVWDKGPAFGMGDLSFPWKPSWEMIYIRGNAWIGRRDEGVLRSEVQVSWESRGRTHPHQKPVGIIEQILSKLPLHFVICDPFFGSGTTAVACLRSGRNFVGCEVDPLHYESACTRLRRECAQQLLFRPTEPPMETAELKL